jgi:hypothetical protein
MEPSVSTTGVLIVQSTSTLLHVGTEPSATALANSIARLTHTRKTYAKSYQKHYLTTIVSISEDRRFCFFLENYLYIKKMNI